MDQPIQTNSDQVIVAWRHWNFIKPGHLTDLSSRELFPGREKWVAECIRKDNTLHLSPGENCSCGLYSSVTMENNDYVGNPVWGSVAIWGKIIIGSKGYRSQYQYPIELFVIPGSVAEPYAFILQDVYGVPVSIKDRPGYQYSGRGSGTTQPLPPIHYQELVDLWGSKLEVGDRQMIYRLLKPRLSLKIRSAQKSIKSSERTVARLRREVQSHLSLQKQMEEYKIGRKD